VTPRSKRSGAALIMSLALLVVVAAAGAALCVRVTETSRSNVAERQDLAARYAAEAGIERARWSLARDAAFAGESLRFEAFDVTIRVTPAADGRREVRAVASSPSSHAAASATLRLGASLPVVEAWRE
jgi:hypothetical protein